jgi:hypothetical protein
MYMISTRVVHDIAALEKIIEKVPGMYGRKMTLSDAARYAVQKLVGEIENNTGIKRRTQGNKKVVRIEGSDF